MVAWKGRYREVEMAVPGVSAALPVALQPRAAGGEELARVCRYNSDRTEILPEGCLALKCVYFPSCYISCGDIFQLLNSLLLLVKMS